MSEQNRIILWLTCADAIDCQMSKVYDVKSPELDDEGAEPVDGEEKPKLKLHGCPTCELRIAQQYHLPDLDETSSFLVLKNVDTVYQPQWGPVCGAASVAGTVLSLLKAAGHDSEPWKEVITVRFVQDIYAQLGVADIDKTTANVGNLTLKKCCMMLRIPSLPGAQLTVGDLTFLLAKDPKEKADAEWARLKRGMQDGARYLYHSRNHYNRIFGWRELYNEPTPQPAVGDEASVPGSGAAETKPAQQPQQQEDESGPASGRSSPVNVDMQGENAAPEASDLGSSAPATGGLGLSARSNNTTRPAVGKGLAAAKRLGVTKPSTLRQGSSSSVPPSEPYAQPSMSPYLRKRQVLMAKKGQRPQHWVDWEDVAADTASHKLHKIFEIKMVQR